MQHRPYQLYKSQYLGLSSDLMKSMVVDASLSVSIQSYVWRKFNYIIVQLALMFRFMPAFSSSLFLSSLGLESSWLCRVVVLVCIEFMFYASVYIAGSVVIFVIGLPHPFWIWLWTACHLLSWWLPFLYCYTLFLHRSGSCLQMLWGATPHCYVSHLVETVFHPWPVEGLLLIQHLAHQVQGIEVLFMIEL